MMSRNGSPIRPVFLPAMCCLLWLGSGAGASAQGVFDMGVLTNTLSMGGVIQSERERAARGGAARPGAPSRPSQPATASMRFEASAARRQANLRHFVEQVRASDPRGSAPLVTFLTGQDVFGIMERGMRNYDLRLDDLADATATYLVTAWLGTRGSDGDPTPAQMAGARRQVAQALAGSPAIRAAGDAARQEMADTAILQAAVIAVVVSSAQGNAAQLSQIRNTVAAGARASYSIDLLSLELSDTGLRPAR